MQSTDAIRNYLRSVRRLTDAGAASLFVGAGPGFNPLLFHEGEAPPLPELATANAAASWLAQVPKRPEANGDPRSEPLIRCYQSASEHGCLLRISIPRFLSILTHDSGGNAPARRRKSDMMGGTDELDGAATWVGLRYVTEVPAFAFDYAEPSTPGSPASPADSLTWTLALGAYMAWQAYQVSSLVDDPTTRLPGRVEFQAHLGRALDEGLRLKQPVGVLLVNPDDFGLVNQRLGQESGDAALGEVADRLRACLRQSDRVFRYGGAVFAAVLPRTAATESQAAAEKLRLALTRQPFLDGPVRLAFSVGAAAYEPGTEDGFQVGATELVRRADRALNLAKLSGGGRTVLGELDGFATAAGTLDRLNGIFTADTEKDYRNMLLLWDTVTVISSRTETQVIANEFVERISATFKPKRVALFADAEGGEPRLLVSTAGEPSKGDKKADRAAVTLSEEQRDLLGKARRYQRTERLRWQAAGRGRESKRALVAYAVPLVARDKYLGCLYVDGPEDLLALDSSDLIFLSALASQVAMALDRAELASQWKQEKERESRRLREEVRELRQAIEHSRLVYRSSQMHSMLEVLGKAAATDATVLIAGESGTGKEMLARTLYELSPRRKRPFVIVDCGAISHSLMAAELFGHVKGAYTGADGASAGRITQAEGGTLFLDEIGEVPLDVQAKLLRFVQEKEITPVGATTSRRVDVRIVAATNRDLAAEVSAGRFRQDLYYRLQVVILTAPPLRSRPDDILPLARYFLEKFAIQYSKSIRRLSPEVEIALLEYHWPGNVRELQNLMLQAVVMSGAEEIGREDIRLGSDKLPEAATGGLLGATAAESAQSGHAQPSAAVAASDRETASVSQPSPLEGFENPWEALREGLQRQIVVVLDSKNGTSVPLGRWLTEDLVLAADGATDGVARRASSVLGMAETTFRRQAEKARRELGSGLLTRTPAWSALKPVLSRLVESPGESTTQNVIERARKILLEGVITHLPDNDAKASALMGVTLPTYRRWTEALRQ